MAELEKNHPAELEKNHPDVEAHKAHGKSHPALDDSEPDEAKLKLANDEDDDVEAHKNHPYQAG
jgi:hypothetical protein